MRLLVLIALGLVAADAGAETPGRHALSLTLDRVWADADSPFGPWPDAGYGKLRYGATGDYRDGTRITAEYRGQLSDQLAAHIVLDYIDDPDGIIGATEAYFEWRPLPTGLARHRYRFGAFYPALSLENSDTGWESPYTSSFAAANTWLGEEVRAIGAEWRFSRPLGMQGSPQEIGAFAGVFYGNDPAGTLLFWRGWSVHDRQTRLNERLPLPALVLANPGGPDIVIERRLDPIAEIDSRPGIHLGGEWSYRQRARLALAFWDNRGDPHAFRDSQWAWGTRFWQFAAQISLPLDVGLVAGRMRGDTDWLTFVTPTGQTTPATELVTDDFDTEFLLLTRMLGAKHRLSLRRDDFDIWRPGALVADRGAATTLGYRYTVGPKLSLELEWLEIESQRDIWPLLYGRAQGQATERQLQAGFRFVLYDDRD